MAENFLGALIADRRRQAGYSQADLARLLPGVSRSALNSNGKAPREIEGLLRGPPGDAAQERGP